MLHEKVIKLYKTLTDGSREWANDDLQIEVRRRAMERTKLKSDRAAFVGVEGLTLAMALFTCVCVWGGLNG